MGAVHPSLIEHWVVEGDDVDPKLLNKVWTVRRIIRQIIKQLGLTHIRSQSKNFGPGVTVVHILAESHLSIHTWPEHGYFYADVATCSVTITRDQVGQAFSAYFDTNHLRIRKANP